MRMRWREKPAAKDRKHSVPVSARNLLDAKAFGPPGRDHPAILALPENDIGQVERAAKKENRDDGQPEGEFVGDHLRAGANASQERILRIGCPAGKDDSVNPQRGDGKDVENANIDIGDDHRDSEERGSKRQHREHEDRRDHRELWCDVIVELVDAVRDEIFLKQKLNGVCYGLPEAEQRDVLLEPEQG